LLTHRIDDRALPELALVENVPPGGGRPALHRFKYPMPGDPLPMATYVAIHVPSGQVIAFNDVAAPVMVFSPFLMRMAWFCGDDQAWFIRFDTHFRHAELICLNLLQRSARVVLAESVSTGYIDLHSIIIGTPNVRVLRASNEIIWFSERDGWGHLYLHDAATGALKNQITSGAWRVRDIVHVDEHARRMLILVSGIDASEDPARRVLCAVNLDGSAFEVIIRRDGDVYVPLTEPAGMDQDRPYRPSRLRPGVSPDGRFVIARNANASAGNVTELVELRGERNLVLASAQPASGETQTRHFTALAADGVTRLHGLIFLPSDFAESERYPLIDFIYPGPQVAHQPQSFRAVGGALAASLAELGFITMMLDTRGMPVGSRAFHQGGHGKLMEPQLADHAAVVKQLVSRHAFIDGERVGMIGWSGGGYATARALFDYGDVFKAGVSACGPHDVGRYAAMWSNKYRGPAGAAGYAEPQNIELACKLVGKLMLISGDMDENVHVSHTLALVDALIRANKDFELLIVPNAGHDVLVTNGYAQRRAWDFFVRHLLGVTPPADFALSFEAHELARYARNAWREVRQ
jgi:dienelactone hydrolase